MHWLDLTLLLTFGVGAFWGALNGFVRQVARVLIFVLAIYLCIYFHEPVANVLEKRVSGLNETVSGILSYALVFAGTVLVGYLITLKVESLVTKAKLQPVNRVLGAGFGVVKLGLIAGAVLMVILSVSGNDPPRAIKQSRIAPYVLKGMRGVLVAVPKRYKENLSKPLERGEDSKEERDSRRPNEAKQAKPFNPYTDIPKTIDEIEKSDPVKLSRGP